MLIRSLPNITGIYFNSSSTLDNKHVPTEQVISTLVILKTFLSYHFHY